MTPDPIGDCEIKFDNKKKTIKVIATENIKPGSRVLFRPPAPGIPNEVFLTSHGYVPEINTNDFIVLKGITREAEWRELMTKVDAADPVATQKFQLLKIFHDDSYSVSAFTLPPRLLFALRILNLNPASPKQKVNFEDLKKLVQEDRCKYFSHANELKVAKSLYETADDLLSKYPTSLEEDAKLLREAPLDIDQRMAIEYRKSKKALLAQIKVRMEDFIESDGGGSSRKLPLEKFILKPVRLVDV